MVLSVFLMIAGTHSPAVHWPICIILSRPQPFAHLLQTLVSSTDTGLSLCTLVVTHLFLECQPTGHHHCCQASTASASSVIHRCQVSTPSSSAVIYCCQASTASTASSSSVVPTSMAPAGLRLQSHGFHNTLSSWAKSSVLHPHSFSRAVHYHCRCSFERNHASSPAAYTETQHLSLALWSSIQSHNVWRDQLSQPVSTIQHLACISQPFSACTIIYQLSSLLELSRDPLVLQFAFSFSHVVSHGLSF